MRTWLVAYLAFQIHRNSVTRGLIEKPEDCAWSSFRRYAHGEAGVVKIESE
jgi:hypothetical protein